MKAMEKKQIEQWLERYQDSRERKAKFESRSGIPLKPVYTSADLANFDEKRDLGLPDSYPYTRGMFLTGYRGRLWTKSFLVGLQTVEIFNQRQRELLKLGQTGINIMPDNVTNRGFDSDMVEPELIGRTGTSIDSLKDMEIAFEGIPLDQVTTAMSDLGPFCLAAMYIALAEKRGIYPDKLRGTCNQSDFLDHYVSSNLWLRFGLEGHLRILIDHIKYCNKRVPLWHPLSIKGDYHEHGATADQDIGFFLSALIFYTNELINAGLDVDEFAPRFSFYCTISSEFFEEIARFRAARRMYARIMRERFGAKNPVSMQFRFFAQTFGSDLTQRQVLNNIARSTLHTLAGVLAGANAIHTDAYDEAWWSPSEKARRIALMTQNIIAEETGIPDVIDPLGGSYFIESLTNEIEEKAWEHISKIDDMGGALEAAKKGYQQAEITRSALSYQKKLDEGERTLVGVNKYIVTEPPLTSEQDKMPPELVARQIERTKRLKRERNQKKASYALKHLVKVAKGEENIFEAVIEAVKADVTNGEIVQELREIFQSGRPLDIMSYI